MKNGVKIRKRDPECPQGSVFEQLAATTRFETIGIGQSLFFPTVADDNCW